MFKQIFGTRPTTKTAVTTGWDATVGANVE